MYATSKIHFFNMTCTNPLYQKHVQCLAYLNELCNYSAFTVHLWQPSGINNETPVLQTSNSCYFHFWELVHPSCKTSVFFFSFVSFRPFISFLTSEYKRTHMNLTACVSQYHRSIAALQVRQRGGNHLHSARSVQMDNHSFTRVSRTPRKL